MQLAMVLVHGAGTGSWIWQRLQDQVALTSLAVELPSRHEKATPASCADHVVKEIDRVGAERVILVLHSLAGVLAAELVARLGDRIQSVVFVAAVIPAPGKRFVDAMGFPASLILKLLFAFKPRGLKPSASMLRAELYNDLSEADAAELIVANS